MKSQILPITTGLIGFILYAIFIIGFNTYYPHLDDFEPLFLPVKFEDQNFMHSIDLLFRPINEHRVAVLNLALLISYYCFQTIDLEILNFITFIPYIALLLLIFKEIPLRNRIWYFSSIVLMLFSFGNYFSQTWLILNYQRNGVIGFGLIAMYLASFRMKWKGWILAILFAILSALSNSDGLFVLIFTGIAYLLKREYKQLVAWYIIVALFLFLFFVQYPSTSMIVNSYDYFYAHKIESFYAFFILMGSNFNLWINDPIEHRHLLFGVLGFLLVCIYLGLLIRSFLKENPNLSGKWNIPSYLIFHLSFFSYLMVVSVILSVLRTWTGLDTFLLTNHRIFSTILMVMLLLLISQNYQNELLAKSLNGLVFLFFIGQCTAFMPYIFQNLNRKYAEAFNFYKGNGGLGMYKEHVHQFKYDQSINFLLKNGGLVMPNKLNRWFENHKNNFVNKIPSSKMQIKEHAIYWENPPIKHFFQEIYVVEKLSDGTLYIKSFDPVHWFKAGKHLLKCDLSFFGKQSTKVEIYFVNISENKIERII